MLLSLLSSVPQSGLQFLLPTKHSLRWTLPTLLNKFYAVNQISFSMTSPNSSHCCVFAFTVSTASGCKLHLFQIEDIQHCWCPSVDLLVGPVRDTDDLLPSTSIATDKIILKKVIIN